VRNDVAMSTLANYETLLPTRHGTLPLIPEGANCLRVELANGLSRELTRVRMSRSVVFGLLEDKSSWSLIRLNDVLGLSFQMQNTEASPSVLWTRKAAGELLGLVRLPAPAIIYFRNEPRKKVRLVVLGATRELVATDSYLLPLIPLQAISYLEISPS
jgi:hypothetical protein